MTISVAAAVARDLPPSRPLDVNDPDQLSVYLTECLEIPIDPTGVTEHLSRCAQDLGFWNKRHAAAIREVGYAETELRRVEGTLWAYWASNLLAHKNKATEPMVKAHVRNDGSYVKARQNMHDAEAALQDLKGVCESIRGKLFALGSMGKMILAEFGEYTVRDSATDS